MASSRSRLWVFTLNNPPFENGEWNVQAATWLFYQKEIGASGTPHLQGAVRFANAKSLVGAKEALGHGAHLEIARGTIDEIVKYCSKDDTRAPGDSGPFEIGNCPLME